MKIYLDDDSAEVLLVRLLKADGHDVVVPDQVGNRGIEDPAHFLYAIMDGRAVLTRNHGDYKLLHDLVVGAGGHHPGVLTVRKDNDKKRDLGTKGIVRALRKFITSSAPITDQFIILNHWRCLPLSFQPAIRIIRLVHFHRIPRQQQRLHRVHHDG